MEKQKNVVIRFQEIKLIQFRITDVGQELHQPVSADDYEFDFSFETNVSFEEKEFKTVLGLTLFDKSMAPRVELASLKASFTLHVVNGEEVFMVVKDVVQIPDGLLKIGLNTAISTSRGMFAVYAGNTKFSNAIVPLVNIDQFLANNPPHRTN